jgi:DNA-directed RNA polymerase sigma subunit (sigma70/sigma32)
MRSPLETLSDVDDSWAYPDDDSLVSFATHETENPTDDDDYFELRTDPYAFASLTPHEYWIVDRRFGLSGQSESMKDIAHDLGCTHSEVREVLGTALAKMRSNLKDSM